MPRILIDCRFAALPVGIGRFTREVVRHLLARDDSFDFVLLTPSTLDAHRAFGRDVPTVACDISHYSIAEQWKLPTIIRAQNPDLVYVPHFNVPLMLHLPFIATVHDLILHRYPNQASFTKRIAYRLVMHHAIHASQSLVTISEATKRDIVDRYGRAVASKITVAYPGISTTFQRVSTDAIARAREKYRIPAKFFLYVGGLKEHKNVALLLEAFRALASPDVSLVLVTGARTPQIHEANVMDLATVPDADIQALYSAAVCFVTASVFEGFGFPPLEAFACGCPAIATNRTAFSEIMQSYGTLVEPNSDALVRAMRMHLDSPPSEEERDRLIAYARTFQWSKTAEKIASIFHAALAYHRH